LTEPREIAALFLGMPDSVREDIERELQGRSKSLSVAGRGEITRLALDPATGADIVLASDLGPDPIPQGELAQSLRMRWPQARILFVGLQPGAFSRKALCREGFDDAYLHPFEREALMKDVRAAAKAAGARGPREFLPVALFDFGSDTALEFDTWVFLPLNKKYVL